MSAGSRRTPTPSLARRVLLVGLAAVVVALVVVNGAVQLAADRGGDLLAVQLLASLVGVLAAVGLTACAARLVLRPVDDVVAAAERTTAGPRGQRLLPDRPDTELGRVALAFDEVLDHLEAGMKVAATLERRSGTFETRWRQVLEAAQEAYVAVDPDGVVVDMNQRAESLFGASREELRGRSAGELVPERHAARVVATISEIAGRGRLTSSVPYELEALSRSGRCFPAECTVWAVDRRGGTVVHVFVRDITERQTAQETAARLAAVIEGSADAIVTEDLDGRIRTWNAAAERMFGWRADEAVGQDVSLIVPAAEREAHARLVAQVARGELVTEYDSERLVQGVALLPVSVRLSPVHDRRGAVTGASSIVRDVTEQRWMAETLDTTLAALQQAADEAQASAETTRRFLADAAHQLRTPMAGIRACAETLLRGAEGEDADRLLVAVVRETSHAGALISGLLHMARLDQGLPVQRQPVDLVELCRAEVERLTLLAPGLEVALDLRAVPDGPLMLDRSGCQELVSNLGDNARRHARARVTLVLDRTPSRVVLAVLDDGPGVPEPDRERVFERFVSLDGGGGTGLGLAIARSLARSMGGDVRYDDGFLVELPVTSPAAASPVSR